MLTLTKLQVKFSKPYVAPTNQKFLRISAGSTIRKTANPAKIINDKSIEWDQSLVLPLMFNREFLFEIYEQHQFGYNQNQFKSLLQGSLQIISPHETWNNWEIYTSERERIGYLQAEINIPNQVKNSPSLKKSRLGNQSSFFNPSYFDDEQSSKNVIDNKSTLTKNNNSIIHLKKSTITSDKVFRIASMVAKITGSRFKKGYVVITIGDRKLQTKTVKSRAGELVFIDSQEMQYHPTDTDATFQIYSINSHNQSYLIAEGSLQLLAPKPPKSISLMKDGYQAGLMLVDSKIQSRNKGKVDYSKIFKQNRSVFQQEPETGLNKQTLDASKNFAMPSTSRIHRYNMQSSRSTLSPKSRVSVMHPNSNISFSKEKRFMVYQDKQNQRVSYLKDRSFDLKDPVTGNFYKGAGFGYGGKTDFASKQKSIPGVGNYQLPSIWDRY